jgi:two-component system, OmpR family, response regulator VanR
MVKKTNLTVLIVEDDRENNTNLAFYFQYFFEKVLSAYDGQEGWVMYNEEVPDLIITDIEMPKMDGLELVQKIRRFDTQTPIIVLSAYSQQHYLLKAIPLQLSDYLIKPITHVQLDEIIRKFVHVNNRVTGKIALDDTDGFYDYDAKVVLVGFKKVKLTNKEIILLELLLKNRGVLIRYDEIEEALYSDTPKDHNALKCIIRDMRSKLPTLQIESVAKWGYKLL